MTPDEPSISSEAKDLQCTEVWGGFQTVDRPLRMPGLDGCVYSRPFRGGAGGDVHYVSSCGAGVYSRLLLADVSGHGRDVARTADRLQRLMRRHIASHSQAALVRSVNREFAAVTVDGAFATAVVMTFDSRRRRLVVSNAGHPPPLLYRAADREWSYLGKSPLAAAPRAGNDDNGDDGSAAADLPLGIEAAADYHEVEYRLGPGDVVVCYTDWLIEARDAAGAMLGFEGLLALARALPIQPPGEMTRALLSTVTRWAGAEAGDDDVTLLLFQASGRAQRTSVATHLLAPFRVLRTVAGSYLPRPRPVEARGHAR